MRVVTWLRGNERSESDACESLLESLVTAGEKMRDWIYAFGGRLRASGVRAVKKSKHLNDWHLFWRASQNDPFGLCGTIKQAAANELVAEFL
jgi:hypothetical protein